MAFTTHLRYLWLACCVFAAPANSDQLVWFAPLDPVYRIESGHAGASDYMDLFAPDASWSNAAARVQVFKIYTRLLTSYSEEDLRRIFADLKRRRIALALEFGPLTRPRGSNCPHVEGFDSEGAAQIYADRIKRAGGVLQFVAMDEPFFHASVRTGPAWCRWTPREVANNAVANLNVLKREFPDVVVGDIEPVPADVPGWLDRYREWIEAYRAAAGSNLAFFHADVRWESPEWKESVATLRELTSQVHIPFGIIYNGSIEGPDRWLRYAEDRFIEYERQAAPPEHVVFQSWYPQPRHVLPENDTGAFTYLINRYFSRQEPTEKLTQRLGRDAARSGNLAGRSSAMLPIGTIRGTVPREATTAMAAIRINSECACRGQSDLTLYAFRYGQVPEASQATTLDFADDLRSWWISGDATLRLETTNGLKGLRFTASSLQSERVNSSAFKVTPGAPYALQVFGRVSPASTGSGHFAVIFLSGSTEVARATLTFEASVRP